MACELKTTIAELNELIKSTNNELKQLAAKARYEAALNELRRIEVKAGVADHVEVKVAEPKAKYDSNAYKNRPTPKFDKLPGYDSKTKRSMTYAGIGSRETPKEILELMTKAGRWLSELGYTLNTGLTFYGKKEGADGAFIDGVSQVKGKMNLFAPEKIKDGGIELEIAKEIHPYWDKLKPGGKKLQARNINQVFGANLNEPVDFVLFWAEEQANNKNRPKGGTGQAVEMARRKGIPTINMADTNWREQLKEAMRKVPDGKGVEDGYEVKYRHSEKGKVYTARTTEYGVATNGKRFTIDKDVSFEMTTRDIRDLYSSYDDANMTDTGLVKQAIDNVNDPVQMKKLAKELADMSGEDPEYVRDMMEVLDAYIDPVKQYLPDTEVWLNKEAERNGGKLEINGEKMAVKIAVRPGNAGTSPLELFVHEVGHGITYNAIESRAGELGVTIRRLQDLRKQFMKTVMKQPELLGVSAEQVMKVLNYVGDPKVGLHEFVAYALSNRNVIKVLKDMRPLHRDDEYPNLFSKLIGMVKKLLDTVTNAVRKEKADIDGHTLAMKLIQQLAEANNRALHSKRDGARANVVKMLTAVEEGYKNKINDLASKASGMKYKPADKTAPAWKQAVHLGRMAVLATVDDRYKNAFKMSANIASRFPGLKWLAPESNLREAISAMADGDNTSDKVDRMMGLAGNIQQHKEDLYSNTAHALQDGFIRKLTDQEEVFVTSVLLDTDAQSVLLGMSIEEMADLIKDDEAIIDEVNSIEEYLKQTVDKESYNYVTAKSAETGKYLVTDKAGTGVLLNAWNIARMAHTSKEVAKPENMEIVDKIDKLISLHALMAHSKESRVKMANMMMEEPAGILQVLAFHGHYVTSSREHLFNGAGDRAREMKGYTKQVYDKHTDIVIAPIVREAELRKLGFTKEMELKKHKNDKSSLQMAVYKSNIKIQQNLNRVALMYNSKHSRGTTFTEARAISGDELRARAEIKAMRASVLEEAEDVMKTGKLPPIDEDEVTVLPVYDNLGKIKDFRYVATKQTKEDVLGMDRRAIAVIARGYGALWEKRVTGSHNAQVMEIIEEDAKNYNPKTGGIDIATGNAYVMVSKDSTHKEAADAWKILPDDIKNNYPDGFPIRQDLLHSYLGKRDYSIADSKIVQTLPAVVVRGVRIAEQVWKDIVQMTKVDWIIKTPIVLIQNVITNLMLSATSDGDFGANVVMIAKLQMEGVKELNAYIKKKNELITLQNKVNAGIELSKFDSIEIKRLQNDLNSSTIAKLIEEGFYTTIAEDLGLEEYGANESMTGRKIRQTMDKAPKLVRNGAEWLYLTSTTPVYKFVQAATVYSDFAARYAHYNMRMKQKHKYDAITAKREKQLTEERLKADDKRKQEIDVQLQDIKDEREAGYENLVIKEVREAFVNYHKPAGFDYMNQMGFMMFSKWFFNIHRAIRHLYRKHPLKALISLIGQEAVLDLDIETVEDNHMGVRMWNDDSWDKWFGVSLRNPLDHIEKILMPSSVEMLMKGTKLL